MSEHEVDPRSTESVFAKDAIVLVSTFDARPDLVSPTQAKIGTTYFSVNGEEWCYGTRPIYPEFAEGGE